MNRETIILTAAMIALAVVLIGEMRAIAFAIICLGFMIIPQAEANTWSETFKMMMAIVWFICIVGFWYCIIEGKGMTDIEQILKHAQLAHFDNECTSMVILMVANGEPEAHMAIVPADVHLMNSAVDMFKTEMLILMKKATQDRKDRE